MGDVASTSCNTSSWILLSAMRRPGQTVSLIYIYIYISHFCIPYFTITVSNFLEIHGVVLQVREAKDKLTSLVSKERGYALL
jgi:hypothetical protein